MVRVYTFAGMVAAMFVFVRFTDRVHVHMAHRQEDKIKAVEEAKIVARERKKILDELTEKGLQEL